MPDPSSTPGRRWSTCAWRRCERAEAVMGHLLALGDPLYAHGVHWPELLIVVIKVLVAFGALMVSVMLMIWFERKVISDMQARIGPNRAGPWGLLQTLADGIKLFFKEDLLPEQRRPLRVQAGAVPVAPARLPGLRHRARGRRRHRVRAHLRAPGGRPADRHPVPPGHVVGVGLRGHAGGLVVGVEVPVARLGAGVGPDDLLRGGAGHDGDDGGAAGRLPVDPGDRRTPRPRPSSPAGTSSARASCPSSSS